MATNYKSCPLKKRPIVFVNEEDEEQQQQQQQQRQTQIEALPLTFNMDKQQEQPQDLSLKRKASIALVDDYAMPIKREYVLNLSKTSTTTTTSPPMTPIASPVSFKQDYCSALLTPPAELDSTMEYRPMDIHLRGLDATTTGYTTNPFQTAFVTAAGCNPMPALWNNYQQTTQNSIHSMYPSPASSVASAPSPCYSYQHITPPSSPGSEVNSEPEDLSVRNDIPLPALFHLFDEAPTTLSASSLSPVSYAKSTDSGAAAAAAAAALAAKNYRFKCEKCNKMYSTSMGLSKHQQFHCPAAVCNQEKKTHSCEECGKLYTTLGALKMHIRTHTLPCKCPICGKAFSRHWLLQGHIRTHTGEKPYKCPDCPRSFADRSNLRAHQQTHVDIKKYACKICHKSFSRMSLLNKHNSSNCTITIA